MWIYQQSTGKLVYRDANQDTNQELYVVIGYSGHGEGKNNPDMQDVHNVGPVPRNFYTIGLAYTHPQKGPIVMRLTPDLGSEMYGRDGFLIHGDSIRAPGTASEGCIILPKWARLAISSHSCKRLQVIK